MVRVAPSPTPATGPTLPKVSFQKVEDEAFIGPAGVPDLQARTYGYNDGSTFKQPEHYVRYIEPLESELAVQVEYDMDEQDQEWIDSVNAERRKDGIDKVSYEIFEVVMDRLEKEWFDLTKNIPKPDLAMPSEDSTCAICDDSEGENTNAIVFCDGCNLAVHQDCYGVPYIPEGQWLCRKCTVSPENPVSCMLCPNEGGAFKQTVHGEWIHLLCAIWVPETRVANDVFMEPVTGVERISKQRWKLKCSICDVREGACIQCIKSSCFTAFHATCARKEKLLMPMKSSQGSEAPTLTCFCEKHLPREQAEARYAALAKERNEGAPDSDTDANQKIARAYAKTYKLGPPLVPKVIVDRLIHYINKVTLRQKREFVIMVCKYWSLKREARRGAPLLKRLHLEPWTASANGRHQSDDDKATKLQFLKSLRDDLEQLRTLADHARRREILKMRQVQSFQQLAQQLLYPHSAAMRKIFESIRNQDHHEFFKSPVSRAEVPDYHDVVKHPMCWGMIEQKLSQHKYWYLQDFKDDIFLVVDNAMLYNKPETLYFKTARRLKTFAEKVLVELDQPIPSPPPPADLASAEGIPTTESKETAPEDPPQSERTTLGDLEPTLDFLDILINAEHISEIPLVLNKDPVDSLFSYELPVVKRPPTPPPAPTPPPPPPTTTPASPTLQPPPTLPVPKPKRDRRADRQRAKEQREALAAVTDQPRTRGHAGAADATYATPTLEGTSGSSHAPTPGPEDAVTERTSGEPPRKRRRYQRQGPEPIAVVSDVSHHQSFDMFNKGWILHPDQRRHGRTPRSLEPMDFHEPRKRTSRTKHTNEESSMDTAPDVDPVSSPDVPMMQTDAGPSQGFVMKQVLIGPAMNPTSMGSMYVSDYISPRNPHVAPYTVPVPRPDPMAPPRLPPIRIPPPAHLQPAPAPAPAPQPQPIQLPPDQPPTIQPPPVQVPAVPEPPTDEASTSAHAASPPPSDDLPPDAQEEEEALPLAIPEEEEEEPEDEVQPEDEVEPEDEIEHVASEEPRSAHSMLFEDLQRSLDPVGALLALAAEASLLPPAMVEPTTIPVDALPAPVETSPAPDVPSSPPEVPPPSESLAGSHDSPSAAQSHDDHVSEPARASSPTSPAEVEAQIQVEEESTSLSSIHDSTEHSQEDVDVAEPDAPEPDAHEAAPSEINVPETTPSEAPQADGVSDMQSDLTDILSDEEETPTTGETVRASADAEQPGETVRKRGWWLKARKGGRGRKKQAKIIDPNLGKIVLKPGEELEGGTLVWARMKGYPWWPSVVFEPDSSEIPDWVHRLWVGEKDDGKLRYIIRFFDGGSHWHTCGLDDLLLLGESQELDDDMRDAGSVRQKWKSANMRADCRKAYEDAIAEMETSADAHKEG